MKLLIIALFISTGVLAQQKDSVTTPVKIDSTNIVLGQLIQFSYDKITAKDFQMLVKTIEDFLKSREFIKPK